MNLISGLVFNEPECEQLRLQQKEHLQQFEELQQDQLEQFQQEFTKLQQQQLAQFQKKFEQQFQLQFRQQFNQLNQNYQYQEFTKLPQQLQQQLLQQLQEQLQKQLKKNHQEQLQKLRTQQFKHQEQQEQQQRKKKQQKQFYEALEENLLEVYGKFFEPSSPNSTVTGGGDGDSTVTGGGGGDGGKLRTNLLKEYEALAPKPKPKCMVTQSKIGVEAAHIKPFGSGGESTKKNGMFLAADLHKAFDDGLWSLEEHTDNEKKTYFRVNVLEEWRTDPRLENLHEEMVGYNLEQAEQLYNNIRSNVEYLKNKKTSSSSS